MARKPTKSTTLHPVAHERLKWLQIALQSQGLPPNVELTDILSALVIYTSPPQVAGMLGEWFRYNQRCLEAATRGDDPPAPAAWE
jgi:hypothetical protein